MSGKHILAFEAEPLYANMLNEALGSRGYQVEIVSEGVDGLEKAAANPPALIYLCVELPRISGFSICNKLKKNGALKDIPLVITSAEATLETFDKHKRLKGHADEYMHKPFSGEEIAAVVEALVRGEGSRDLEDDGEEEIDDLMIEDEEAVVLESEDELNDLDDLEDVEGGSLPPSTGRGKVVDSDINQLADEAFEGLEIKDPPAAPAEFSMGMPSVSAPDIVTVSESPEDVVPSIAHAEDMSPRSTDSIPPGSPGAVEKLKEQNRELKKKLETLEKQLIAAKTSKKSGVSSSEFLDLREALNNKDRELLDLKDAVNGKEKEVLNLRDKINGLERQKADLEDKNIDGLKHINQVEHQLETLTIEHEHLTRKSSEQEQAISELEDEKTSLEDALSAEKAGRAADIKREKESAASALQAQHDQMEKEANERREAELAAKQAEHDAAFEALTQSLTSEKEQALAAQHSEYEAKIEELNRTHKSRENELSGRIVHEQDNVKRLEAEKVALESELVQVRDSLDNTVKQLEITQQTLKETGEALENEQREHGATRSTLAETKQQLKDQTARGDHLDTVVADLEKQIADLNTEVEELTALIQRNEEVSVKARKAVAIAQQLLDDMETLSGDDDDDDALEEEDEA